MKLLRQGTEEELCGAYSIAMVTDKPLKDVFNALGHREKTTLPQLSAALMMLGYDTNTSLALLADKADYEGRGIVILYTKDMRNGHAVAFEDGKIYDCDNDTIFNGIDELLFAYNDGDVKGGEWFASKVMKAEPAKMREWAVGSAK